MWVLALNLVALADAGCAIAVAHNLLDQENGVEFLANPDNAVLYAPEPSGTTWWVPYGWTLVPCYTPPASAPYAPGLAGIIMIPVLAKDNAASTKSWQSIVTHNNQVCSTKAAGARQWTNRWEAWKNCTSMVALK